MAKAEVRIFNRTYALNAPTESQEDLLRYAAMVDEKMREIAQDTRMVGTEKIALVAALNIAAEYFKIKVKLEELEEKIDRKVGQIVQLVEKAQGEGGQ
jgi:cell division protein ZapA